LKSKRSLKAFDSQLSAPELQEHVKFIAAELSASQDAVNKLMSRVGELERFERSMRNNIPYGLG
jgi:hypothetical protein